MQIVTLKKRLPINLILGPLLALVIVSLGPLGDNPSTAKMAAIAVWMAFWWVTEAVPIPVTALLPLVLMPLASIAPMSDVAINYGRSTIFLFLGGFLLALGLQASGVHKRLALGIIHFVGDHPRRIVLGFMLASAFLSMWISNTATVMVLMPIGLSVIMAAGENGKKDKKQSQIFAVAIMLGIAYAADIGGMSTLVGTPPNLSYKELLIRLFDSAPAPSFMEWMILVLPLSMVFLVLGSLLLTYVVFRFDNESVLGGRKAIKELRNELGPLKRDEVLASTIFALTALLWMFRKDIQIGSLQVPGWSSLSWFESSYIGDGTVAIAMAVLLFIIPSKSRPQEHLLEWSMSKQVPWGMLLLFGGGFALAYGFKISGLSLWLGNSLLVLKGLSPLLLMTLICLSLTFLTELTSNTATTEMVLPILAAAAVALEVDPRYLMIPATLSASCAFMMPVASPTQAIVFASGYVPIKDMIRAGIWFNFLGVLLVVIVFALLCGPIMGIDPAVVPDWAVPSK